MLGKFTEASSLMSEYVKDSKDSPSHMHGEEKVRGKFSMQLSSATKIEQLGKARERERKKENSMPFPRCWLLFATNMT